ncbi:hypothetical protein GCM10008107_15520 [Psychrosphaera saromensis]|uniref:DUF1043 domain-containing protein n=1 Tax=Psychrosphaera saromensis TaxID=716813 RepID=A0A2S7UU20_9GAMM|nr:DUF1043 family protein [Psychrosphaera saromensis]PQJ53229.1 hypothetical protein BTO11_05800 [Psychrosphaera saromensis]GHB66988.1 hypothetical protein GCM10008107_15520 [Psychrosphaera saromensis]GLQ15008.1 hypothetical protein GCM10007917_24630 [Psychrosphaera saromensis]
METVIDIMVFALGVVVGIGIMILRTRMASGSLQAKEALSNCQQENAQLKQNWQDNLAAFRSVATNLHEMSKHIDNQIEDAEHILEDEKQPPAFPFFSKEATNILSKAHRKPKEESNIDNQPLDYSGSASGVFKGSNTPQKSDD